MRRAFLLSTILLFGCASSQGTSAGTLPDQTIRIPTTSGGSGATMTIAPTMSASTKMVGGSMERVWDALPAVFATLGVPVTDRDAATHTIGNSSLKVRRKLADVPLSRYLECGSAQGVSSADSYEIILSVTTRVQSVSADSTVATISVDAMGRPVFVSSEYIHCGTTGALEKRFFDVLNVQLKR